MCVVRCLLVRVCCFLIVRGWLLVVSRSLFVLCLLLSVVSVFGCSLFVVGCCVMCGVV